MLDYCRWWGRRKAQLASVLVFAAIMAWMTFALVRSERRHLDVLREVREGFRREAIVRDAVVRAIRRPAPQVATQSTKPVAP